MSQLDSRPMMFLPEVIKPARVFIALIAIAAMGLLGGSSAWLTHPASAQTNTATDYDADDDGLIEVGSLAQLDAIRYDLDGDGSPTSSTAYDAAFPNAADGMGYELTTNLDFDTNVNGEADAGDDYWNGGAGWEPITDSARSVFQIATFHATFEGNSHVISGLYIDRSGSSVGLFGRVWGGEIRNLGLEGVVVKGGARYVGGLAGSTFSSGSFDSLISTSYVKGSVSGESSVGGLVGSNRASIDASYAAVSVSGTSNVGGLVGNNNISGSISASYATGSVTGGSQAGGLVGNNQGGSVTASYATGSVTGTGFYIGGLVGDNDRDATITASYATGSVSGRVSGGLVGVNVGTIADSYAIGAVSGSSSAGGLVGANSALTFTGTVTASYWDTETSGQSTSPDGEGKTTSELQSPTSNTGIYATWDGDVWDFGTSSDYPSLIGVGPVLPVDPVEMDRSVLAALYNATDGDNWDDNTNWLSDEPLGDWHGVTTDDDGRVDGLTLSSNSLAGTIPVELGSLSNLTGLYLHDNHLAGAIPTELGNLSNLKGLALNNNQLTGEIPPELGNLSNLAALHLSGNRLTGCIPAGVQGVKNNDIDQLDLSPCSPPSASTIGAVTPGTGTLFISWTPPWNDGRSEITAYDLRHIETSADETDESNWTVVDDVWTSGGGTLQYTLTGLTGGTQYDLQIRAVNAGGAGPWSETGTGTPTTSSACVTEGAVIDATNTGLVSDCEALLAWRDALAGKAMLNWSADTPIADWDGIGDDSLEGSPTRVTHLYLSGLELDGMIPNGLSNLSALKVLHLHDNELTGIIPSGLGDLSNLTNLLLHDNDLTGEIPAELGELASLQELSLYRNDLSGSIPAELGKLTSLTNLSLHDNDLTGEIPAEIGKLSSLESLDIAENNLSGSIPGELGELANLVGLDLSDNDLEGEIPGEIGGLSKLQELYLHRNKLSGQIPDELGKLSELTHLWLSSNYLSGQIPRSIGSLTKLTSLRFADNALTGCVPANLLSVLDSDVASLNLPSCGGAPPTGNGTPTPTQAATQPGFGTVVSEGVAAHGATAWHNAGWRGQGVKVGILDLFEGFRDLIEKGELPANVLARCFDREGGFTSNLADCEGVSDHGTKVAEVIMDVAPEATLYIANVADRHAAVLWMLSQGVEVINHSSSENTWDGPGDGSSPYPESALKVVDLAVEGGAVWINSGGNSRQEIWFGDFSDPDGNGVHNFTDTDECNWVEVGRDIDAKLRWDDAWQGAARDLDIYILNADNETVATSVRRPDEIGLNSPFESIRYDDPAAGRYCLQVRHSGGPKQGWLQLYTRKISMSIPSPRGHIGTPEESANPGMMAVGAAGWWDTETTAEFSSRGPTPDGRTKPEIVGATRVRTASGGGSFSGTSAAAPHVAGLAVLVKSRFPHYTPLEIVEYLKTNALPRGEEVPNNTWGYGFAHLPQPDGLVQPTPTPTPLDLSIERVRVSLSAGTDHVCALRPDGAAVCWGRDGAGQASPPAGETFVAVSSGGDHTCALRADGAAVCWGDNDRGKASPPPDERFVSISSGFDKHTCGLRPGGAAVCWGENEDYFSTPPRGETFTSISSNYYHTCGLRADGTAVCWGENEHGRASPPDETFVSISTGQHHGCGLRADGTAVCWGRDDHGQASPPAGETFAVSTEPWP